MHQRLELDEWFWNIIKIVGTQACLYLSNFFFQRMDRNSYNYNLYFPRRIPRGEILNEVHRRSNKFVYFLAPQWRLTILLRRLW